MCLPIQANLFNFLQQLCLTYAAVTLWVDALCINQNDNLEKNNQNPLMGPTYSYTQSVLVWLGPQADGSEKFVGSCNQVPSESQPLCSRILENLDSDATNHSSAAIASLQRRTYWTRTWIIQDTVLASDIHIFCGDRYSHWPNFIFHMPDQDSDNLASRNSIGFVVLSHNLLLRTETHCRIWHHLRQKLKHSNVSHSIPSANFLQR